MPNAKSLEKCDIQFSDAEDAQKIYWISREALAVHFGATGDAAVPNLGANKHLITAVARKVARGTPPGEHVLVKTADF